MATNNSINANSTTPLPIVDGGTGVNAVTTAPAATTFAGWDANKNLSANNLIDAYTTTATAAGTTTLTVASTYQQFFTGSTTQTVVLPVTSTLVLGQAFLVVNNSSGVVTVQSSGANTITAMAANAVSVFTCILTSGTSAASWSADYELNTAGVSSITGTANQVVASASTGAVTLSLPQSIATTSDVTFGSVAFSPTTKGIVGTTTANDAASGYVGYYLANSSIASLVTLTTNTLTNLASINLPAGDFDVFGYVGYDFDSTTNVQALFGFTNSTSAAFASDNICTLQYGVAGLVPGAGQNIRFAVTTTRYNLASPTTIYLIGRATFTVATCRGYGNIAARIRR
jgi:hypothetical protein